jgi:hypothetical protein
MVTTPSSPSSLSIQISDLHRYGSSPQYAGAVLLRVARWTLVVG